MVAVITASVELLIAKRVGHFLELLSWAERAYVAVGQFGRRGYLIKSTRSQCLLLSCFPCPSAPNVCSSYVPLSD